MSFRKIEKKIKADGWVLVRICGSHYQYSKAGCAESVVIPYHGSKDISIALQGSPFGDSPVIFFL